MTRFLRFISSLFAAASIVCFAISATSLGGAAFADEPLDNTHECGSYTNNGRCSDPEKCTAGTHCNEAVECPCINNTD